MRLGENCRVEWLDVNERTRRLLIRDRKDPRNKRCNDQRIPLFAASGFDGWSILGAQALFLARNVAGCSLTAGDRWNSLRRCRRELEIGTCISTICVTR